MFVIYTILLSMLLMAANAWASCPVVIRPMDFSQPLQDLPMGYFHLFSFRSEQKQGNQWQEYPVQIDPIDGDGRFIFYRDPTALKTDHMEKKDRIIFDSQAFGGKYKSGTEFPCKARRLYEIADARATNRFAYLAFCTDLPMEKSDQVPPVQHKTHRREIVGDFYTFNYSKKNHILFDKIVIHPPKTDKQIKVASNSQIRIHANMKKFFNFDFDSKDILSRIEAERSGRLGFIGFAAFYLKILFLSIDLKLYTGISFLPDNVSIPMIMQMPVNPRSWVHPGSGILYSWQYDPDRVKYLYDEKLMPRFDADLARSDPKGLVNLGLKYCGPNGECTYRMPGLSDEYGFTMDFILPRAAVEMGFFPMYVDNPVKAQSDLKWSKSKDEGEGKRLGFYFESSQLTAGEHRWDFWIRMAPKTESLSATCPHPAHASAVYKPAI